MESFAQKDCEDTQKKQYSISENQSTENQPTYTPTFHQTFEAESQNDKEFNQKNFENQFDQQKMKNVQQLLSVDSLMYNIENSPSKETQSTCEQKIITLLTQSQAKNNENNLFSDQNSRKCSVHPSEDLLFSCFSCNKISLCVECVAMGEHKFHDIQNIKNAQKDIRQTIGKVLSSLKLRIEFYNYEMEHFINEKNELIENNSDLKESIIQQFTDMMTTIQETQRELMKKIDAVTSSNTKQFETILQKRKRKMKVYIESHKMIEQQLNQMSDEELFSYYIDKQQTLGDLQNYFEPNMGQFSEQNEKDYNLEQGHIYSIVKSSKDLNIQKMQKINFRQIIEQIKTISLNQKVNDNNFVRSQPTFQDMQQNVQKTINNQKQRMNSSSALDLQKITLKEKTSLNMVKLTPKRQRSQELLQRKIDQEIEEIQNTRKLQQQYNNKLQESHSGTQLFGKQRDHSLEELSQDISQERNQQRRNWFKKKFQQQCDHSFRNSHSRSGNNSVLSNKSFSPFNYDKQQSFIDRKTQILRDLSPIYQQDSSVGVQSHQKKDSSYKGGMNLQVQFNNNNKGYFSQQNSPVKLMPQSQRAVYNFNNNNNNNFSESKRNYSNKNLNKLFEQIESINNNSSKGNLNKYNDSNISVNRFNWNQNKQSVNLQEMTEDSSLSASYVKIENNSSQISKQN